MYQKNNYMCISIYDNNTELQIYEHRLNALINYSLKDVLNNDVHHKNGCRFDNSINNIEIINRSKHTIYHNKNRDEKVLEKMRNSNLKKYYRIVKNGICNGKQKYKLVNPNGEIIKQSFDLNKLQHQKKKMLNNKQGNDETIKNNQSNIEDNE